MTDNAKPAQTDTDVGDVSAERKAWHRPTLVSLGSVRDMTMTIKPGTKYDGNFSRNTRRGGDFEAGSCRR